MAAILSRPQCVKQMPIAKPFPNPLRKVLNEWQWYQNSFTIKLVYCNMYKLNMSTPFVTKTAYTHPPQNDIVHYDKSLQDTWHY